ncbi:MAG: hypothetical protein ACOCXT_01900 [Candidatus Dojkabacteria bacterium]
MRKNKTLQKIIMPLGVLSIFIGGIYIANKPIPFYSDNSSSTLQDEVQNSSQEVSESLIPISELQQEIYQIWNGSEQDIGSRKYHEMVLRQGGREQNPYVLYNIEVYLINLVRFAAITQDTQLMQDLLELLAIPAENIQGTSTEPMWLCGSEACLAWESSLKNEEIPLISSQYLYMVAYALTGFQDTVGDTPEYQDFARKYSPIIESHLRRYIFDQTLFRSHCSKTSYNHNDFLEMKLKNGFGDSLSYCNAAMDTDLWILATLAEFMAYKDTNAPFPTSLRTKYLEYLQTGGRLIRQRVTNPQLTDNQGNTVEGWVFDPGAWTDHPHYQYAGYNGDDYPGESDRAPVEDITWDISHSRRIPHTFLTFIRHRELLGLSYPTIVDLQRIGNQLVYSIYNQNPTRPLFSNFFGGQKQNGWYKVQPQRDSFGHPPSDLSSAIPTGGYGFLTPYHHDIDDIMYFFWENRNPDSPEINAFFEQYYYRDPESGADVMWFETREYYLQTMLPSLVYLTEYGSNNYTIK